MSKITPFLWFDKEAQEAANFYAGIFPGSKVLGVVHSSTDTPSGPKGMVLTVDFELDGTHFTALNGGPNFKFNEAVSFVISCKDQEEIDYYWEKLSAVKESEQCGWLKDKYGLSWQVVPENLDELLSSDPAMKAMMEMKKINIKELKEISQR